MSQQLQNGELTTTKSHRNSFCLFFTFEWKTEFVFLMSDGKMKKQPKQTDEKYNLHYIHWTLNENNEVEDRCILLIL